MPARRHTCAEGVFEFVLFCANMNCIGQGSQNVLFSTPREKVAHGYAPASVSGGGEQEPTALGKKVGRGGHSPDAHAQISHLSFQPCSKQLLTKQKLLHLQTLKDPREGSRRRRTGGEGSPSATVLTATKASHAAAASVVCMFFITIDDFVILCSCLSERDGGWGRGGDFMRSQRAEQGLACTAVATCL